MKKDKLKKILYKLIDNHCGCPKNLQWINQTIKSIQSLKRIEYKDNKWLITYDDKDGLRIYIQCECGNKHDIHLNPKGNFQGRETLINLKRRKKDCPYKTTCDKCGHYDYETEKCNLGYEQ